MRFLCLLLVFLSSLTASVFLRGSRNNILSLPENSQTVEAAEQVNDVGRQDRPSEVRWDSSHDRDEVKHAQGTIEELKNKLDDLNVETTRALGRYIDIRKNPERELHAASIGLKRFNEAFSVLETINKARNAVLKNIDSLKAELKSREPKEDDDGEKNVRAKLEELRNDMDFLDIKTNVEFWRSIDLRKTPEPKERLATENLRSLLSARKLAQKEISPLESKWRVDKNEQETIDEGRKRMYKLDLEITLALGKYIEIRKPKGELGPASTGFEEYDKAFARLERNKKERQLADESIDRLEKQLKKQDDDDKGKKFVRWEINKLRFETDAVAQETNLELEGFIELRRNPDPAEVDAIKNLTEALSMSEAARVEINELEEKLESLRTTKLMKMTTSGRKNLLPL